MPMQRTKCPTCVLVINYECSDKKTLHLHRNRQTDAIEQQYDALLHGVIDKISSTFVTFVNVI